MNCHQCSGTRITQGFAYDYEFMGKTFRRHPFTEPCISCSVMWAEATRTDCITNEARTITVEINAVPSDNGLVWKVLDGPTGYENMYAKDWANVKDGWAACFGTKNRWDRLFIAGDQMAKVAEALGTE